MEHVEVLWAMLRKCVNERLARKSADREAAALDAAIASLSAPQPPAEAQAQSVEWVREWQGSGPQRGFHIREATRLHNNRVVAYLGDQVDSGEVDRLIAEHNGKHPNGEPLRPAEAQPVDGLRVVTLSDAWDYANGRLSWNDLDARAVRHESAATPLSREHGSLREMYNPSAPVGVEGFDEWFDEYTKNNYTDEMLALAAWKQALAQQPAAVDEAMVERAFNAWCDVAEVDEWRVRNTREAITAALTAALAAQQGGAK